MAVLLLQETRATREQYDRVDEILRPAGDDILEGLIQHSAGFDGDTLVVVDVWESEEALGRFVEGALRPALEQAGVESTGRPRVLPIHNRLEGAGSRAGVMLIIEVEDLGPDGYDRMASTMPAHAGDPSQGPWLSHTAARTEGGGILVVDVWDSVEAFGRFAEEQIGPAGEQVGLGPIEPRALPLHHHIRAGERQASGGPAVER